MSEIKDVRYTMRVSTAWLDEMFKAAAEGPLSNASFIQEAAKIGAPELRRRLNGETLPCKMEDQ